MINVAYFGWHIHSEIHDLCTETSCPVSSGDFVISHSQVLPGYTPPVSHLCCMCLKEIYQHKEKTFQSLQKLYRCLRMYALS